MEITKVSGYLNLARKAGALIIGSENLKMHNKKLYLILLSKNASLKTQNIAQKAAQKSGAQIVGADVDLAAILNIKQCQIVGVKNKGFADMIKENLN